jgi:cytochrome c551/c552
MHINDSEKTKPIGPVVVQIASTYAGNNDKAQLVKQKKKNLLSAGSVVE